MDTNLQSVAFTQLHRLGFLENEVLKKIFGTKKKLEENGENCIMWSFVSFTLHQMLLG
jgi:hypothetical protein